MYVVVLDTCKKHEGEWAGIPKLVSAINEFETALNELNELVSEHSVKTVGISSTKALKLEQLYMALEDVHNSFKVLSIELQDPLMKIRNNFPRTTLLRMSGVALKTHISRVAEDLAEYGALFEPYGLDNARLSEILQLIDECKVIISSPRIAIVQRKNLTESMLNKTKEIDAILKERIDTMIRLLKRKSPNFFNQYFAARIVINRGVRHQKQFNKTSEGMNALDIGTVPSEPDDGN